MRRDRVASGVYGLLVGDALGVPFEFHAADDIPPADAIEIDPPPHFRRAHAGVPPGTWSDDGAHALCLLASLLHCGRLDVDDLGRRLVNWYEWGYLAVDDRVFDVGVQTAEALRSIRSGVRPIDAGPSAERHNGNGSLMRVLPLSLWHRGSDRALVDDAMLQSRVTHGHVRSQVCCALYCLWARRILADAADPYADAIATLRAMYAADSDVRNELEFHIRPDDEGVVRGTGYVVDCLRSARHALAAGPYEAVVRAAIRLGNDTDTTACVAGGLAGVRDGLAGIPSRWLERLRGRELVDPLVEQLVSAL